jgi:hypothetical protein
MKYFELVCQTSQVPISDTETHFMERKVAGQRLLRNE